MSAQAQAKAEAREFSDVWGEFIHSGRWYRGIMLSLTLANIMQLVIIAITVTRPDLLPFVVRVDEVGRAEVVDYQLDRAELDQNSPVVGFFLNQFVVDHYSRRHALHTERWERSLLFLTPELQQAAYTRDVEPLSARTSSSIISSSWSRCLRKP